MVKYSRFVRKTSNGDPIKWIEVLSLDQLPLQREFDNFIDPSVYHSQPEIEETCNKDLRTFALVNARAAYCVKNNIDFKKYSMRQFYLDLLRSHYPPVYKITEIKLQFKVNETKYNRCIWKNCKKNSKIICNNNNCTKRACKDHMQILCCECFCINPSDILTKPDHKINPGRICKIKTFCKVKCRVICASASCARYACADHRNPICLDCCIMKLFSGNSNYSEKIVPRKKFA